MLKQIWVDCIDDLFSHIPESLQLKNVTELHKELEYKESANELARI